jgi:sarcosine oxidase subunit beta
MSLAEVEEMDPPDDGNEIPLCRDNLAELARRATRRCPILDRAEVRSGWAGLRTLTPDERPVLGAVTGRDGLFVAAGFSGYGVTLSPFVGEALAAAVAGEEPLCGDVSAFAPERFC